MFFLSGFGFHKTLYIFALTESYTKSVFEDFVKTHSVFDMPNEEKMMENPGVLSTISIYLILGNEKLLLNLRLEQSRQ